MKIGFIGLEKWDQAFEAAETFPEPGKEKVDALLAKIATVAATGKYEPFKKIVDL